MHNRKSKDQNHWRVTLNEIHKDRQNERYFLGVRLYHVVLELFFFSFLLKPQRFFLLFMFHAKSHTTKKIDDFTQVYDILEKRETDKNEKPKNESKNRNGKRKKQVFSISRYFVGIKLYYYDM